MPLVKCRYPGPSEDRKAGHRLHKIGQKGHFNAGYQLVKVHHPQPPAADMPVDDQARPMDPKIFSVQGFRDSLRSLYS